MRNRTIAAGIVASVLLAAPQAALAQDATDDLIVADPVVDTTMVSVFGTDISLAVAVDADGNLTSVELTDGAGGAPEGAVATEVSPHEVKFVIDDAGTTIEVEVEDRKIETEVEARALTDLTGNHSWTGELFGAGNGATDIAFTVTDNGGIPAIELTSVAGLGAGSEVVDAYTESEGDKHEAKVKINLTDAEGNRARITIEVEVFWLSIHPCVTNLVALLGTKIILTLGVATHDLTLTGVRVVDGPQDQLTLIALVLRTSCSTTHVADRRQQDR